MISGLMKSQRVLVVRMTCVGAAGQRLWFRCTGTAETRWRQDLGKGDSFLRGFLNLLPLQSLRTAERARFRLPLTAPALPTPLGILVPCIYFQPLPCLSFPQRRSCCRLIPASSLFSHCCNWYRIGTPRLVGFTRLQKGWRLQPQVGGM